MWPKILNSEIILIYFLLLIPWPDTHVIKLFCSKDNSRLVRKIVRSKWTPILDKYQVKLPLECPLHPFRDLFAPRQDAKKRDRPTQWTCRKCGKSFYQEKFLDLHFETRHKSILNNDEDAVCLADLCDILRCEVFQSEESSSLATGDSHIVTDVEVWGDSLGQNSALAKANAAYLSLIPLRNSVSGASRAAKIQQNRQLCQEKIGQNKNRETQRDTNNDKTAPSERSKIANDSAKKRAGHNHGSAFASRSDKTKSDKTANSIESSTTNQSDEFSRGADDDNGGEDKSDANRNNDSASADSNSSLSSEAQGNGTQGNGSAQSMQKVRAHCRPEELSKLKAKCEYLVRSCIASSLLGMTDQAFKEMEEEMNKAVCWYLTCDRYWEDGPLEPRAFPWSLVVILVFVLSMGMCFCYYIIWILFDSEETTINTNHQSYMHYQPHHQQPYQQHGVLHGTTSTPQNYYYQQQQQQHDLYPEQPRYEYHRHSPRRYNERTHQSTPTAGGHQVPPTHPQANLAYPTDIYDRRDYTNRATTTPIPTTVVGGSCNLPAASGVGGSSHHLTAAAGTEETAASMAAIDGGTRHYNPNQHHPSLESHHRHIGASQTSLRGSASAHEIIQSEVGHNEHYIYVTYPPDLKKRFFEKYE